MNDGIVLLAKQPNQTSFYSLNSVKKALGTSKVGHTGTLDSFAQGLLVVCVGKMTKLAGNITEFDKSYEAVIQFGEETEVRHISNNILETTVFIQLSPAFLGWTTQFGEKLVIVKPKLLRDNISSMLEDIVTVYKEK